MHSFISTAIDRNALAMAPGNPLWMQWVTEKAEEDEERGMESANAFYKVRSPRSARVVAS